MERCTRPDCHRAGPDLGTCVDGQTIVGCAPRVTVNHSKDLVVFCRSCDKTLAFTLDDIMHGRVDRSFCRGDSQLCSAVVLTSPKK